MTEPRLTPSKLWRQMTGDQRLRAAKAFWQDEEATDDQVQAVFLIAERKRFRSKFVLAMDADRKSAHLASLAAIPEAMAARTLIIYHLAEQRPLMGAFLDALGIAHEDGLIQDDGAKPDPTKIPEAVAFVREKFPGADVTLYLQTLLSQDPETWGALGDLVAS